MKMTAPLEVGLCCSDLDALSGFYIDTLGFTPVTHVTVPAGKAAPTRLSEAGYSVIRLQSPWGERLKLLQPLRFPEAPARTPWILDRRGATYLTFIVDNLAAMLERLTASGIEIMTGPDMVEVRPGVWLVFARDPEGNVIEFVEYADLAAYRPDLAR